MSRKALFDFARPLAPGGQLTPAMVAAGDAFADALGLPREGAALARQATLPVAPAVAPPAASGFGLGDGSRKELQGVEPRLVRLVERAIQITAQDFAVHDGLRTLAEQQEYVRAGVSQTMNSKHRPQGDGYGHAVDLVPFINGKLRWEWDAIYPIAAAMWQAAREQGTPVRWGGAWIDLFDIPAGTPAAMKAAVDAYGARQRKAGKKAFTDGPHFELIA